ncbi:MAG: hypothetical protein HY238_02730 [Acidobacteria bacterium]|nr:hypothetical protein [Acidobacteriota bacterium]
MRTLFKIAGGLVALYLALLGGLLAAMYQPPARFARIVSKVPGPVMRIVPFPPLWRKARAGRLQTGDPAPDFELPTLDKQSRVRLSSLRSSRPVVLVFGSYT